MIFQLFKCHFDINWYKFEERWADVFQIYPNAIHFSPPKFCPSLFLLSFPVFCLSSSIVLSRYFVISVNSMTTWSMLKLPKIAWPSHFKPLSYPSLASTSSFHPSPSCNFYILFVTHAQISTRPPWSGNGWRVMNEFPETLGDTFSNFISMCGTQICSTTGEPMRTSRKLPKNS